MAPSLARFAPVPTPASGGGICLAVDILQLNSPSPTRPPAYSACPPPRPRGAWKTKSMQLVRSLAGTRLRSAPLRSAWSSLACHPYYITLRSIESMEHSFAARAYAGAPSLEAPSLRCSSLGASSLVAPMLRPSSLGDSMPSISLLSRSIPKGRNYLSPTRPPLAPVRSRPSLALGTCPARQLAAPRPARGGHGIKQNPKNETKYLSSSSARARGTPYPPRAPPSLLGSRLLHH